MYFAVGILGLIALAAAVVLGMRAIEGLMARLLGLPSFRWFEVEAAPLPSLARG